MPSDKTKIPLADAVAIFEELQEKMLPVSVEVAGSIRRRKETVGDLDILVWADARVIGCLPDSQWRSGGKKQATVVWRGAQINAWSVEEEFYGAMLLHATGSGKWNKYLRAKAIRKGTKLSQYGLFDRTTGLFLAGRTEMEVLERLEHEWVPPEGRSM